jgi:hypothetical protein
VKKDGKWLIRSTGYKRTFEQVESRKDRPSLKLTASAVRKGGVVATPSDETPKVLPHWDATKISGQGAWEQKRRLARAMRLVIERLVPSNAPEDELRRAADGLERYAEALTAHPRLKHFHGYAESANAGDVGAFFDQSPLIGLANPLAPPMVVGRSGPLTGSRR